MTRDGRIKTFRSVWGQFMARLNIETEALLKDRRFIDLIVAFGSRREAFGAFMEAIMIAQQYWVPNRLGIPKDVWLKQRLANELIDVELAVVVPATDTDGERVRVAGSAEQFDWLIKAAENGRKGGLKKQENFPSHPKETLSDPKDPVPSYLLPLSSSLSSQNSCALSSAKTESKTPAKEFRLEREHIDSCADVWKQTLEHFNMGRDILEAERMAIGQSIVRLKSHKAVAFALEGARYQPKDSKYDPAKFLNLSRILDPDNFNRFLNLGVAEEQKRRKKGA